MMFVFPLSGTHIAEIDRKFMIYYAFIFRTDGGATDMTTKLAELETVLQERNSQIEKVNVRDYSCIL
jgi:hypothetical protein